MDLFRKRQSWQKITHTERIVQERVAVLATFTVDPLIPYLGLALEEAGLSAHIWVGPYNQVIQQCLDEQGETASMKPTILVIWPRLEELWGERALPLHEPATAFANEALELAQIADQTAQRWQTTLIYVLPAIPEKRPLGMGDACNPQGVFAVATSVREALRQQLAGQPNVLLIDLEEALRSIGSAHAYNPRLLALAHVPFSETLFSLMGERLARLIQLHRQPARKALVLDADDTLWGGIVGEEGALGVDLDANGPGAAFRDFQAYLQELRRTGVLLALNSKNDAEDVRAVFARHEMRLKFEDLAAWRINWQAKSRNIMEIADELHLGFDSFVFIDDNAAEIAEVRAALPEVACLQMPSDPVNWLEILQQGALDRLPPTADDLNRALYYAQERQRSVVSQTLSSPEDYLAQLKIEVAIYSATNLDIPRLTQLIAKTNQFNLNCRRRSAQDLIQLCADPAFIVRLTRARDRFGDYGIIGAYIARIGPEDIELDTFVLSCRAMGRGIEEAMIADLFAVSAEQHRSHIIATVKACPRNAPAQAFFARLGCQSPGIPSHLHRQLWPSHITQRSDNT